HHRGRAGNVVYRSVEVRDESRELLRIDVAGLTRPRQLRTCRRSHCRNEFIIRIALLQFRKLIQKRRVLRPSVRIAQLKPVWVTGRCSLNRDAAKRSDPDSPGEEYRGPR